MTEKPVRDLAAALRIECAHGAAEVISNVYPLPRGIQRDSPRPETNEAAAYELTRIAIDRSQDTERRHSNLDESRAHAPVTSRPQGQWCPPCHTDRPKPERIRIEQCRQP